MANKNYKVEQVHPKSKLTFIGNLFFEGKKKMATYKCSCGNEKVLQVYLVKKGQTKSCGCIKNERIKNLKFKHGLSKHPLFKVWHSIKERCRNKNDKGYKNYGAKGIKMCEEWYNDFKKFYDWCIANGWERGMEVDKDVKPKLAGINPYIYSPEWCSIVNRKINNSCKISNRFIEYNGRVQTLHMWAKELGINVSTLSNRINVFNWGVEKAFGTPPIVPSKIKREIAINEIEKTIEKILNKYNSDTILCGLVSVISENVNIIKSNKQKR